VKDALAAATGAAEEGPAVSAKVFKLLHANPRFVPALAGNLRSRDQALREAFAAHVAEKGFAFTTTWTDQNIPYVAPLLGEFARDRERIEYLEIGVYEGRTLAFMDWLFPGKVHATIIDPWYDPELDSSEDWYIGIEERFRANAARLALPELEIHRSYSSYELPKFLQENRRFDLIYIDGSHSAWAVYVDLCYAAALIDTGGLIVLDDYWHDDYDGSPGVKQAVDGFHATFRAYFEVEAVYRQVILRKTADFVR